MVVERKKSSKTNPFDYISPVCKDQQPSTTINFKNRAHNNQTQVFKML
jgi:hypothetical protein